MQATFNHAGVAGDSKILVSHGKECLEFDGGVFQQTFRKGRYEPYTQINRWWNRIDANQQEVIFQLLREAKLIMNEVTEVNPLIMKLRPIIHEIINLHDTEEYERWIRIHAGIWLPEELQAEYDDRHPRPGTREQTYLIPDYWELVTALMKQRAITPIIGEFVDITKRESGALYRDLNAYFLMSKSRLVVGVEPDADGVVSHAPEAAMTRLNNYIEKNIKQDGINFRATVDGIGSDLYQTSLLANVMIRHLSLASLTRDPAGTHVVQVVHKALSNRLSQNDSHQNTILEKTNPNEEDSSEDSSSRAEKYKNKPLVAPGEFTAIETFTGYTHNIAARLLLKNELTPEEAQELDLSLQFSDKMQNRALQECQIHLIRWVVSPIIPARALWDINHESSMRLAGIAEFVLWKTGFKDLACLVTARSLNAEGKAAYATESRGHIQKELIEQLNELYPYYKRHPSKKQLKIPNDVVTEINNLSGELSEHTWFLNIRDDIIAEMRGSAANKTYRTGYSFRTMLAEYVIYVQKRNAEFISLYNF